MVTNVPKLTHTDSVSMRLINIDKFLEMDWVMRMGGQVYHRTKVLELRDDKTTKYAILSHRWIDPTEVDYEEMVGLAKMDREERDEIRGRRGYQKILDTCYQAKDDGYEWMWADTCCIDKRSSAELSEAINSMYRWYQNAQICYGYLHDVPGTSFPIEDDDEEYPNSNGWPEWFSRGWTLQEMIAPRNVRFFNMDWQFIGDKKTLAKSLKRITRVPEHILTDGLSGNRPCVAQIMSWAAERTTTRVEDRAYSLMGLLDVNMPMLYGEGEKAFHRLQLEVIRTSNDQSIFAWGCDGGNVRTGSILADGPSFFKGCSDMELMDPDEFIESLKELFSRLELPLIDQDRFGTFPITNRGIQIWMLLCPYNDSDSVFRAWLPCCCYPLGPPVYINLAPWNFNYYRYSPVWKSPTENSPQFQFCQVYLRYQDVCPDIAFEINSSADIDNGFTCYDVYPLELTQNALTLTATSTFCARTYSERRGNGRFAVVFGQHLGRDWIHLISDPPRNIDRSV